MAVRAALDSAALRCMQASDCENISIDTACHASCGSLTSKQDKPAIEAVIAQQNATTCKDFEASGCDRFVPPCIPPRGFGCVAGHCEWLEDGLPDAGEDSGIGDAGEDGCFDHAIKWGADGGLVGSRSTFALAPCRAFSAEQEEFGNPPEQICSNEVPADGDVTVDDIDALIANADVQAAIAAAPVVYGVDSRPVDGTVLRIEIDGAIIDVGSACDATSSPCVEIPAGVAALQGALEDLFGQQHGVSPTCMNTT